MVCRIHERLAPIKSVYVQIILFNTCYIVSSGMRFYYRLWKSDDGIDPYPVNAAYTIFSVVYLGTKLIFVTLNWTFAFQYWIVSLTLKQALTSDKSKSMS